VEVGGSKPPSPTSPKAATLPAGRREKPTRCLIFLDKQALWQLFLAICLYRIAFPQQLRRQRAPACGADMFFTGGFKDRKHKARTA
jgi:hypothetical protein